MLTKFPLIMKGITFTLKTTYHKFTRKNGTHVFAWKSQDFESTQNTFYSQDCSGWEGSRAPIRSCVSMQPFGRGEDLPGWLPSGCISHLSTIRRIIWVSFPTHSYMRASNTEGKSSRRCEQFSRENDLPPIRPEEHRSLQSTVKRTFHNLYPHPWQTRKHILKISTRSNQLMHKMFD